MKNPASPRSFSFFGLSLVLHAILALVLIFGTQLPAPRDIVTMEILDAVPAPAPQATSPEVEVAKIKKKKLDESPKIVDQDEKAVNDELDENARFLSRHNQRVEKQTVAKNRGEFQNRQKDGASGKEGSKNPQENPMERFLPKFDVVKSVEARAEREEAYDADAEKIMLAQKQQKLAEAQAAKTQKGEGQDASKGSDVSQTLDYIKDLDPGLETMLSSKEFKFYTYFSRVRKQLNLHWTPKVRTKVTQIYRQGRRIASTEDMITRCLVTLDSSGKLLKVQIIGKSGVIELDEAAVEAFRSAAPFPNPPKGMVDPDGTIKLRWDFILEA